MQKPLRLFFSHRHYGREMDRKYWAENVAQSAANNPELTRPIRVRDTGIGFVTTWDSRGDGPAEAQHAAE